MFWWDSIRLLVLGHNQAVGLYTENRKSAMKEMTQMLTWKPKCGKNHGSPQTAEYTMGEEYNNEDIQRQRPLVLFFATRGGYSWGNDLSLSLTLSLYTRTIQLLTTIISYTMFFALSHIYTYMTFGLFTHVSLPIGRTDRNRVFGLPVLPSFHPEGPVSQQIYENS